MIVGTFSDRFPRVPLRVHGTHGSVEVEVILDTAFDGFLVFPSAILNQVGAMSRVEVTNRMADGSERDTVACEVIVEWDGEQRTVEALSLDTNPLLGTALIEGCHIDFEAIEGGEVIIESLN